MTQTATNSHRVQDYEVIEEGMVDPHLVMTTGNIRSNYDQANINDLAENIRRVGLLEPILCRPLTALEKSPEGPNMCLVAGYRRLCACRDLGMPAIPYRLLNLNVEQAAEIQLFENLHRESMSTMDEARAFSQLLEAGKYTKKDLAARVNKSESYVTKALTLLELPKEAMEALEAGKLTPSHCHQILRVPAEKRAEIAEWASQEQWTGTTPTLNELIRHIESQFGRSLENAVFPQDCEYAGAVACTACPSNTANQTMLFAEAEAGQCMNPDCFAAKVAAFDAALAEEAAGKYKGMKCLGTKEPKYTAHGHMRAIGKGIVVEAELAKDPAIKKALKANPGAFAYAVDANTHTTILVLQDQDMVAEIKKARQAASGGEEGPSKEERAKQEYVAKAVQKELLTAAAEAKITVGVPEALKILNNLDNCAEEVLEAFGADLTDTKKMEKLPLKTLLHLIYLCSITRWDGEPDEKLLAKHGVNVKTIKKSAAKVAAAQYAIDQAEAAEAKKAKKNGKGAEVGEEEGEEEGD